MLPARNTSTSAPATRASRAAPATPSVKPRSSGVRALLGTSTNAPATPKLPAPPRMPTIKSSPPPPVTPASPDTIAIRVEEIRSIAREVAARESEAKKAERLHAVAVPVVRNAADESSVVLRQMFPHLVRQSPFTIAVRVVFFLGYVALAIGSVLLRGLRRVPHLALQARDGLRHAWIRTAFRHAAKP